MNRLESIEPQLWTKLTASTSDGRRSAVLHACEYALRTTALENEAIMEAFAKLVMHEEFTPEERDALLVVVEELDALQDQFRESDPAQASVYFNQARAAAAVYFATVDTDESAAESLYEAIQSNEEIDDILHHIHNALDKLQSFLS